MVFELGFLVNIFLGVPTGYPLGYSINMLLGLTLNNSLGMWEVCLFGFLLRLLYGFIIGTREVSLVLLPLVIPLGSPFDSPNPVLTGIILDVSIGNSLG